MSSSTPTSSSPSFMVENRVSPPSFLRQNAQIFPHRYLEDEAEEKANSWESLTCVSKTSCNECYATYGCHWCEDSYDLDHAYSSNDNSASCHAYLSFWGCAWGQTCSASQQSMYERDCMRDEPEPWEEDYGSALANATGSVFFAASVGLVAFFLASVCVWWKQRRKILSAEASWKGEADDHDGKGGFVEMIDTSNISQSRNLGTTLGEDGLEKDNHSTPPVALAATAATGTAAAAATTTATAVSSTPIKSIAALLTIPLLVGLLTGLSTAYAPRPPIINICSNSLDWSYVMNSFASGSIGSSFNTLFSIYNPNRYNASLLGTYGAVRHKGTQIAFFRLDDLTAVSHAVTDFEAVVYFQASTWKTFGLVMEYYAGTLSLVVHIEFGFKVENLNTIQINWTSGNIKIKRKGNGGGDDDNDDDTGGGGNDYESEDEEAKTQQIDRHLCKCSDW